MGQRGRQGPALWMWMSSHGEVEFGPACIFIVPLGVTLLMAILRPRLLCQQNKDNCKLLLATVQCIHCLLSPGICPLSSGKVPNWVLEQSRSLPCLSGLDFNDLAFFSSGFLISLLTTQSLKAELTSHPPISWCVILIS